MLATLARGSLLLFLATMLVVWALSLGKSEPRQPSNEQIVDYLYS